MPQLLSLGLRRNAAAVYSAYGAVPWLACALRPTAQCRGGVIGLRHNAAAMYSAYGAVPYVGVYRAPPSNCAAWSAWCGTTANCPSHRPDGRVTPAAIAPCRRHSQSQHHTFPGHASNCTVVHASAARPLVPGASGCGANAVALMLV
jgi:hypothetical protein